MSHGERGEYGDDSEEGVTQGVPQPDPQGVPQPNAQWEPRPLGPDSLLWRYAGDHRLAFAGPSAGLMQLLHPAIGAGVIEHSDFFNDPWGRIMRSIPQILGVVYDPDPEATGHRLRDYHRPIKGIDDKGRRYSALAPETFWYAHATFQHAAKQVVDRFDHHRLTGAEREELYLDGVEWYRRYGVSMRPVPPDYESFRRKWRDICDNQLELTPAAARAIDLAMHDRSGIPYLPAWTRPLQVYTVRPVLQLLAFGGLPDTVRKRFGIPWGVDDQAEYFAFQVGVREAFRWVPQRWKFGPTATAGRRALHSASA